jgi:hypothetical protein
MQSDSLTQQINVQKCYLMIICVSAMPGFKIERLTANRLQADDVVFIPVVNLPNPRCSDGKIKG